MLQWFMILGGALATWLGQNQTSSAAYGPHRLLARSATEDVKESSGVARSRLNPDVYWTLNDSGKPRIYAFRLSADDRRQAVAADLGWIELQGGKFQDCEDLAAGPDQMLYLFDGGDNPPCRRGDKRILRLKEPKLDERSSKDRPRIRAESIRFEYPAPDRRDRPALANDQRYDAECLLVHPASSDLYIVTKRNHRDKATARVYRLRAAALRWDTPAVYILEFVTDISPVIGGYSTASMITGGSISDDGRRVVLRTYAAAYEFHVPEGKPLEAAFEAKPLVVSLLGEPQGEGVCYSAAGDLILTSETPIGGPRFPIYVVPAQGLPTPAPATASAPTP